MSTKGRICLAGFLNAGPQGTAGWRHPDAAPDFLSAAYYTRVARMLEDACFDMVFIPDALAVPRSLSDSTAPAVTWGAGTPRMDPMIALGAMAGVTSHIGLAATMSTSFNEPYNIARSFATFDHLSGGRAGWNVVTSFQDAEAQNFGVDRLPPREARYDRAEEVLQATTRLWDSWADDALVEDRGSGLFGVPEKVSDVAYRGEHVRVRGPLAVPRPPQGYPVIVQAGASPRGRDFAARWADVIFCSHESLESAIAFYADMKSRAAAWGRDPEQLKILSATSVIVGTSEDEALRKKRIAEDLVLPEAGLSRLAYHINVDLTRYDLDSPLPPLEEVGIDGHYREIVEFAQRENATLRQLGKWYGARSEGNMVGTPRQVADAMIEWQGRGAADGFMIIPTHVPGAFDDVITLLLPELRRRNVVRTAYEGTTLRDHLGLSRPARGAWRSRTRERGLAAEGKAS
ncbi:LLM class flavin-dependent oxidoreductase [Gluconacetobacter sp. Hr-1-5]|uniref:LLM class flavin-dependent oxidoreductase n=1 Tax=Gluconacetobacter sp. Hr-1-5 TaxID=3395370 RepID=UPI003B527EF9